MNDEHEDPVFDSYLEEVLGNCQPPDLKARILQQYRAEQEAKAEPAPIVTPQIKTSPATRRPAKAGSATPRRSWTLALVTGGLLAALALILYWMPRPAEEVIVLPDVPAQDRDRQDFAFDQQDGGPLVDSLPTLPEFPRDLPATEGTGAQVAAASKMPATEVVALIDRAMRAQWEAQDVEVAPPADDRGWCEHVYRQLLGRDVSPAELERFLESGATDRRPRLVAELLHDPRYAEQFRNHFAALWTDVLMSPQPTLDESTRGVFRQAVANSLARGSLAELAQNVLWDQAHDGLSNRYRAVHGDQQSHKVTEHAARTLFGQSLGCARCHDHPQNPQLTQRSYWELNALFRQLAALDPAGGPPAGSEGDAAEVPAVFFEQPDGQMKAVFPSLPGSSDLPRNRLADSQQLPDLILHQLAESPVFREAMVNRVWSFLFGYGLATPVDDMGEHKPAAYRQLLTQLSEQLAAHEFDLRSLVGWLALSEPFGLSEQSESLDSPELGAAPLFSHRYERDDFRTELKAALAALESAPPSNSASGIPARKTPAVAGEKIENPTEIQAPTDGQSLVPDPRFARAFHAGPDDEIQQILDSSLSTEWKIRHLFLGTVHREPTRAELARSKRIVERASAADEALDELWWTLYRSAEAVH